MALKFKLASLEGIAEDVQKLYKKVADGSYQLDLEGAPAGGGDDLAGLKAKVQELLDEKKTEQQKRKQAEDEAARIKAEADLEAAKKKGNIDEITKSLRDMHAAELAKKDEVINSLNGTVTEITVGAKAQELAAKLAKSPEVIPGLLPHIRSRLSVEVAEGKHTVRVMGDDGKPSALTIDEFEAHLKTVPYLQPLIIGSRASGGGNNGGGGGAIPSGLFRDKMTPTEKATFLKEHSQEEYFALPKSAEK